MTTTPPEPIAWEAVAPLPMPLDSPAVRHWQGRLFVLGAANHPRKLFVYDVATDTWSERTPMPSGAIHPFVAHGPNQMIVAGGLDPDTGAVLNSTWRYRDEEDDWTEMDPMPGARHTNGASIACGSLSSMFVAGGLSKPDVSASSVRRELYVYDFDSHAWSERAPMPVARYGHAIGHSHAKFYIVGGMELGGPASTTEFYDPILDAWSTLAAPPMSSDPTVATVGGQKILHTCAGATLAEHETTHVYDIPTDAWSELETTGHDGRTQAGSAREGDYYYLVGGRDAAGAATDSVLRIYYPDADVEPPSGQIWPRCAPLTGRWEDVVIDPPARTYDQWGSLPGAPRAWYGNATGSIDGIVYTAGGRVQTAATGGWVTTAETWAWDPAADSWTRKADMPQPMNTSRSVGVIGGKLYVAGGNVGGSGSQNYLYAYDPATDSWATLPVIPGSKLSSGASAKSAALNGKLYVFGGAYQGTAQTTAYAYDVASGAWSAPLAAMPAARSNSAVCTLGGKLYVSGGSSGSTAYNNLWEYDPVANTWATKAAMPAALTDHILRAVGGRLYAIGGHAYSDNPTGSVYIWDPTTNSWATGPSTPRWFTSATAAATDSDTLYVIGGSYGSGSDVPPERINYPTDVLRFFGSSNLGGTHTTTTNYGSGGNFTNHRAVVTFNADTVLTGVEMTGYATVSLDGVWDPTGAQVVGALSYAPGVSLTPGCSAHFNFPTPIEVKAGETWTFQQKSSIVGPVYYVSPATVDGPIANLRFDYLSGSSWTPDSAKYCFRLFGAGAQPQPVPTGEQVWVTDQADGQMWPRRSPVVEVGHWEYPAPEVPPPATAGTAWTSLSAPPGGQRYCSMGLSFGGKLYVIGGCTGQRINNGGTPSALVDVFDPSAGTWSAGPALPGPIGAFQGGGVRDGKIYVVGRNNTADATVLYCLDPAAGSWSTIATPAALTAAGDQNVGSTLLGGKLYAVNGAAQKMYSYDFSTGTWTAEAAPIVRRSCAVIAAAGAVWILGGTSGSYSDYNGQIFRWAPGDSAWAMVDTEALYQEMSPTTLGGKIYLTAGYGMGFNSKYGGVAIYDPVAQTAGVLSPGLTYAKDTTCTAIVGTQLFDIGGSYGAYNRLELGGLPDSEGPVAPIDPVWVVDSKVGQLWP